LRSPRPSKTEGRGAGWAMSINAARSRARDATSRSAADDVAAPPTGRCVAAVASPSFALAGNTALMARSLRATSPCRR
jgi:hypothetical protein